SMTVAPVAAAESTATARARSLYREGNTRFDRGDFVRAIEAYEASYALVGYPAILFNLGLAQAEAGRPVEAVASMERLLTDPGSLRAERIAKAREVLTAQRAKTGLIDVRCSVDGARVRVDDVDVGVSPLTGPIRVEVGTVVVWARKPGFAPTFATVEAARDTRNAVTLELTETSRTPGQLEIFSALPDAEVRIDGRLVARTPLRGTLPLAPDRPHTVEVFREGYRPASQTITVSEGATRRVVLEPEVDPTFRAQGTLVVELQPPDASLFVNGVRREVISGGRLRLAPGPHDLRGERDGYDALERRIVVPPRGTRRAVFELIPLPATRAALIDDAERGRSVGWGLTVGGGILTVAGAVLLPWALDQRAERAALRQQPGNAADLGLAREQDNFTGLAIGAGIGAGVGLGLLIPGLVVLATGDDPDAYRRDEPDDDDDDDLEFFARVQPSQFGLGVRGPF
ncbi:MAG: PEGA domain-containing protein, partial [Myxococcota bacterium]